MVEFATIKSQHQNTYLDFNATTPLSEDVSKLIPEWLSSWGNPSSIHWHGRGPKKIIRDARSNFAKFIGANIFEVVFTSGGSESNNAVIKGVYRHFKESRELRNEYIFSSVEHPSLIKQIDFLTELGCIVHIVPVSKDGFVDIDFLKNKLSHKTALVSFMTANNETGTIFPISEIAKEAKKFGALMHTDCVQALGKIEIDFSESLIDYASFSGHKFYSLRGAGALYVSKNAPMIKFIEGGGQERGRRGGTENTLAIASLGEMCRLSLTKYPVQDMAKKMENLRDFTEQKIISEIKGIRVTGGKSLRLPNSMSLVIDGIDGESLLMSLDISNFSVSTGAACSSGSPEPSPVLLAMGLSRSEAQSSLRVAFGWSSNKAEAEKFVDTLKSSVARLRDRKVVESRFDYV